MLESNWVCEHHIGDRLPLVELEMLKGFGWRATDPTPSILVLDNHPHVPDISLELDQKLASDDIIPGFLIRQHGITAWGKNILEARNRIELFYYIFAFMCKTSHH